MTQRSHPTPPAADEYFDEEVSVPGHSGGPRVDSAAKTKRFLLDLGSRWYWIALGLLIGILASSYYLSKAPKQYRATSTLLIKQQTSTVMNRDQVEEIDMRSTEGLNTVAARIGRIDLLERVASRQDVRELPGLVPESVDWLPEWASGWFDGPEEESATPADGRRSVPAPPALAGMIGSWMTISIQRGTRLLDISIRHQVPEVAKALADAVAREYLAEIAGSRAEGRDSSIDLLTKEINEAQTRLEEARGALATYARALEMHLALEDRELAHEQMSRELGRRHPDMLASVLEMESRKTRFLAEFDLAINSATDRAHWQAQQAQIDQNRDNPETYLRLARQLLLARSSSLEGSISSQASILNTMMTRLDEASINRQSNESSAEVSSLARVPGGAVSPIPKTIYTTGGMTGMAAGLLIALMFVKLDNKFHTVAQVEAETGLPVLAAVSELSNRHLASAEKRAKKKQVGLEEENPQQEDWDQRLVFRPGTSRTSFAEMYRILRASVSLLGDETARKVTLFTSALPGEGKSLTSANFALAAAGQGKRTLLIDLDLRKPALHHLFGMERDVKGCGVTEYLAGQATIQDAIITETGAENLHLILSGNRAPNPGELLSAARLQELLDEVGPHYDVIVLDTAPLLAVPDTRVVAPLADNLCLVVRAEYVPKGAVNRTLDLLDASGTVPGGLVFNGFKETRRVIGQNYSYGHYRMSRYGNPYQYGYGGYGAYGAYGEDDEGGAPRKNKKRKPSPRVKEKV